MATFRFVNRDIDIHWNGYDITGPAGTVFSIPDQLYEEFESDLRPVEPSLEWIDTNEFQTLKDSVPSGTYVQAAIGQNPISVSTSSQTATISLNSGTALNGYLLVADGTGGTIWNPASTSGLTSVVGVSPISSTIAGGVVSVSLTANYQTAGTYVNAVIGTSPASVSTSSGTSTVSIDQAAITGATAATNAQVVRFLVKNTTGTTIPKGSAVYVSGATGDNALISLASATADPTSSKTLGLTLTDIATDDFGYVVESGYITDIDTSSTTAGAAVWLGNTPGSLVFVSPPAEPSHAVYLGVVVRVQSMNGSILVKVQNGYELDELHDVFVGGVSTALPLVYNSTSSGWVAQALTSVGVGDNAIVTSKIVDSAVTSAKIADNAVIAAKIAASAVGITKIDSGAASSGQVLTADGSSGVSFTTFAAGANIGILASNATAYTVNTHSAFITTNIATASNGVNILIPSVAIDETNNILFAINGRNTIRKIDLNGLSQMATLTVTANVNERLTGIAFGASKLIVVSGPTAALGSSQYFVIDPSALTVQNTGNLKEAANFTSVDTFPTAKYDAELGEFTVHVNFSTTSTGVMTAASCRGALRTVHPTTYATRVSTSTVAGGAGTLSSHAITTASVTGICHPLWVASESRWFSERQGRLTYFSDSAASTGFLTETGSTPISVSSSSTSSQWYTNSVIAFDPTSAKSKLYIASAGVSYITRISLSSISADYNTVATIVLDTRTSASGDFQIFSSFTETRPGIDLQNNTFIGKFSVKEINGAIYMVNGSEVYYISADPIMRLGSQSDKFSNVADSETGYRTFATSGGIYYDGTSARLVLYSNNTTQYATRIAIPVSISYQTQQAYSISSSGPMITIRSSGSNGTDVYGFVTYTGGVDSSVFSAGINNLWTALTTTNKNGSRLIADGGSVATLYALYYHSNGAGIDIIYRPSYDTADYVAAMSTIYYIK